MNSLTVEQRALLKEYGDFLVEAMTAAAGNPGDVMMKMQFSDMMSAFLPMFELYLATRGISNVYGGPSLEVADLFQKKDDDES